MKRIKAKFEKRQETFKSPRRFEEQREMNSIITEVKNALEGINSGKTGQKNGYVIWKIK